MYGPQQKTLDLMCGEEVEQQLLAYNERCGVATTIPAANDEMDAPQHEMPAESSAESSGDDYESCDETALPP